MQPEGAARGDPRPVPCQRAVTPKGRYPGGVRRLAVAGNLEHQRSVGGRQQAARLKLSRLGLGINIGGLPRHRSMAIGAPRD